MFVPVAAEAPSWTEGLGLRNFLPVAFLFFFFFNQRSFLTPSSPQSTAEARIYLPRQTNPIPQTLPCLSAESHGAVKLHCWRHGENTAHRAQHPPRGPRKSTPRAHSAVQPHRQPRCTAKRPIKGTLTFNQKYNSSLN